MGIATKAGADDLKGWIPRDEVSLTVLTVIKADTPAMSGCDPLILNEDR